MKEIEGPLWNRGKEALEPKTDVLYPEVHALQETIDAARKKNILTKREDGYFTPIATKYDFGHWSQKAEAHVKPDSTSIYFAVTEDKRDDGTTVRPRYFQASDVGTVVDLDTMNPLDKESDDYDLVQHALVGLRNDVGEHLRRHEAQLQERQVAIRMIGGIALGLGIVGGLVGLGVKTWIIDPANREETKRIAYDETSHDLSGEGVSVDDHPFALLSSSDFAAIPDFGGSDRDFSSPRVIELSSEDGCDTETAKITGHDTLYAATRKGTKYSTYHYTASATEDGFKICLTEPIPDHGLDADVPVAIQIR